MGGGWRVMVRSRERGRYEGGGAGEEMGREITNEGEDVWTVVGCVGEG